MQLYSIMPSSRLHELPIVSNSIVMQSLFSDLPVMTFQLEQRLGASRTEAQRRSESHPIGKHLFSCYFLEEWVRVARLGLVCMSAVFAPHPVPSPHYRILIFIFSCSPLSCQNLCVLNRQAGWALFTTLFLPKCYRSALGYSTNYFKFEANLNECASEDRSAAYRAVIRLKQQAIKSLKVQAVRQQGSLGPVAGES